MATSRKLKPATQTVQHPRHELLQVAEVLAQEKGIDTEEVVLAMEHAMQRTAKQKYGLEHDIRVTIDRSTGHVTTTRCMRVVETIEDPMTQVSVNTARLDYPDANIDDELEEELPPIEFGRIAAQTARQVIVQKVREAERARQYDAFKDRLGEIVNVLVKRVEFGNVIVDLGKTEGIIRKDETIPRENFRTGDRVRALIRELRPDAKGPIVILSRTAPEFMEKLFLQEVPEIYDGLIKIKGVARDPGSRAKMAVYAADPSIDPVGACVGMRGSRVQAIVSELQGEKVDIITWTDDLPTMIVRCLAPAEITKVVLDEDRHRADVVVPEDQQSLAIGRRGQNVRLGSQLLGWKLDILTEEEEVKRRLKENSAIVELFMKALDVDDMFAQLLISEGLTSIEEISSLSISDFTTIEGIDDDVAAELQNRARNFLKDVEKALGEKCDELGLAKDLKELNLSSQILLKLLENNIKSRDDLAELSGDELQDIVSEGLLSLDQANAIILKAREHWFQDV